MGTRILIVDDDPDVREMLHTALGSIAGVECAEAESAAQALDVAARGVVPDLAVVDLLMPGEDGFSLCRALRSRYGNRVALCVLSGRIYQGDFRQALSIGVDAYLAKPVELDRLLDEVKGLLNRSGNA